MKRNLAVLLALLGLAGCGDSRKPIVVGSKSTTMNVILAEIIAQHLEKRLGMKVEHKRSLGGSQIVYQALVNNEIGLYPEETGTIETQILKEQPSEDASIVLERVRGELRRISQIEVLDPLGINNEWAIVISKSGGEQTLSDAAQAKNGWRLGVTRDFNERVDGITALNRYHLPMAAAPQSADPISLYNGLTKSDFTMIASNITDGALARQDEWRVLKDDQKVFGSNQTCVLVRKDLLDSDPRIQKALAELSGKISAQTMRTLDAQVDIDRRQPTEVAAAFLAGMK